MCFFMHISNTLIMRYLYFLKIFSRYAEDMEKICRRYGEDMQKGKDKLQKSPQLKLQPPLALRLITAQIHAL